MVTGALSIFSAKTRVKVAPNLVDQPTPTANNTGPLRRVETRKKLEVLNEVVGTKTGVVKMPL